MSDIPAGHELATTPEMLDGTHEIEIGSLVALASSIEDAIERTREYENEIIFEKNPDIDESELDEAILGIELTKPFADIYEEWATKFVKPHVQDILNDRLGRGAVEIKDLTFAQNNDPQGFGRESAYFNVEVDGEKLYEGSKSIGADVVHDGHGISGFVRTAEDDRWAVQQVVNEAIEENDALYFHDELAEAISEYLDFSSIEKYDR